MFTYYVVKKGDTLTGIARKFETSVELLQKINRIQNADMIYAGDRLIVPVVNWNRPDWWEDGMIIFRLPSREIIDQLYIDERSPQAEKQRGNIAYTVEEGETLNSIARRIGTTVNILRHMNDEEDIKNLRAGKVISVPQIENSYVYSVRPGDSMYKIAQRFSVDPDMLMRVNYVGSDQTILPGMQLMIPFS